MGKCYVEVDRDYRNGAIHIERALQTLEKNGTVQYGPTLLKELQEAWELLAVCHYKNGELQKCVSCCVALLKANNRRLSTLVLLLNVLSGEKPEAVFSFLTRLYQVEEADEKELLLQACKEAGARELEMLLGGEVNVGNI